MTKAYFRKSLLDDGLRPDSMHMSDRLFSVGIDWSKSYVSSQPDYLDGKEYNMILVVDGEVVFVNSIDFDFE